MKIEMLKKFFWNEDGKVKKKNVMGTSIIAILLVICLILGIVLQSREKTEEASIVYKETTVEHGSLSVGISEDSTIDIGSQEQTFDLDISAMTKSSSSASTTSTTTVNMGGDGMSPFAMMNSFASSTTEGSNSSSTAKMTVDSILVTVGQYVNAGDDLIRLTADSVEDIRSQLTSDVDEAKADLDAIVSTQASDKLSAEQTYTSSMTNGKYAELIYNDALKDLEDAVADAQKALDEKNEDYQKDLEDQAELQTEYDAAKENLDSVYSQLTEFRNYVSSQDNPYENTDNAQRIMFLTELEFTAMDNVSTLEDDLDAMNDQIEKDEDDLADLQNDLTKAQRDQESGKLTAKETYDQTMLSYHTAEEMKAVSLGYLEVDATEEQDAYDEAVEKLNDFDTLIVNDVIQAKYSGVITEISVVADDDVSQGTSLVSLYDETEVTMSVNIAEDDMTDIAEGDMANVTLAAYEDTVFTAEVTEIGDAEYSSSDYTEYYPVTVTLQGDVSELYQGMTGEITFLTKETNNVDYVSNRAVFRESNKSYVKLRDENGDIVKQEITTGFSDGINVEVVEGLNEGDVVLIESVVAD
ncbi:MAG: HlyD family efflux transporter periplasmic adaptor subunit [Lachnospiraceae bacterium]|nr:HlyD family efflux transporter periplasmic adaptor subunit [Lachnospiraceae bacterium]